MKNPIIKWRRSVVELGYWKASALHANTVRQKQTMVIARAIAISIDVFKKDYNTLPSPVGPAMRHVNEASGVASD